MSREIRRVPLEFAWPLKEVWEGFLNPHYQACPDCRAGWSAVYWLLHAHVSALMWDQDALRDNNYYAAVTEFLCGRSGRDFIGHDSCDASQATEKLGTWAGLPDDWWKCKTCGGSGIDPSVEEEYEAWTRTPPPEGAGWQVWETVSEGSPISPVLETSKALVDWLVLEGYSRQAAESFAEGGWVPSLLLVDGKAYNDIESAAAW